MPAFDILDIYTDVPQRIDTISRLPQQEQRDLLIQVVVDATGMSVAPEWPQRPVLVCLCPVLAHLGHPDMAITLVNSAFLSDAHRATVFKLVAPLDSLRSFDHKLAISALLVGDERERFRGLLAVSKHVGPQDLRDMLLGAALGIALSRYGTPCLVKRTATQSLDRAEMLVAVMERLAPVHHILVLEQARACLAELVATPQRAALRQRLDAAIQV